MERAIYRILDANLDRAREGLRIIEEWCRFSLNNQIWAQECKQMRQELAKWHTDELRQARDTPGDVGTQLSHPGEEQRNTLEQLLQANFCRIQEALRVLEEYAKLYQLEMSKACKQMRYRIYSLESNLLASRSRHQLQNAYLYLVTSPRENLLTVVESALQGGLTLVQYRNKKAEDMVLLKEAKQLCQLCHQYGALFIINDRVDLAVAVNADGVHLGQQDMPLALAREILGTDKLIGRSATNKEEMTKAIAEGADYLGVGPVYETPTKPGKTAAGFDYFRYVAANCPIPWFAIGGINSENLDEVLATGAKRVAVVRAIMQAEQPKAVVEKLLTQLAKPQSTPCSTTQVS